MLIIILLSDFFFIFSNLATMSPRNYVSIELQLQIHFECNVAQELLFFKHEEMALMNVSAKLC